MKIQITRFSEGTIELTKDEILRLEIKLIELGRLLEIYKLDYDNVGNLVVKYEPMVEFIDQQTQPSSSSSVPTSIYSTSQTYLTGQPSRAIYNEYGSEKEDIKPREKRIPLQIIDNKLLLDNGRSVNLTVHDLQRWATVIEMWSQMVARKYDELEIKKTPVEMYGYLEKFLGETARAGWETYKLNFPIDFVRDIELGAKLYNFTNQIQILVLRYQPNT